MFRPISLALLMLLSSATAAEDLCGPLKNAYGPFDFTNVAHKREHLGVVEEFHFDRGVESLRGHAKSGYNPGTLAGDIDYTLRAFPNHHRALYTLTRYWTELERPDRMRYSADCYFRRAMRFQPKDHTVLMIYGIYLKRLDKLDQAIEQFETALTLAPEAAEIHYNLGLVRLEEGNTKAAVKHARIAYEKNYPLPGLANRLRRSGIDFTATDVEG